MISHSVVVPILALLLLSKNDKNVQAYSVRSLTARSGSHNLNAALGPNDPFFLNRKPQTGYANTNGYPSGMPETALSDVDDIPGQTPAVAVVAAPAPAPQTTQYVPVPVQVTVPVPVPVISDSVTMLNTPEQTYQLLASKGESNAKASAIKTLVSATLGGAYVGMGGMLSLAVAGNMMGVAGTNPGLQKLMFAILFPVNLWLALLAGGQLFTGNTANMAAAICEKKATFKDLARSWSLSLVGNMIGCVSFAVACKYAGVLDGGPAALAAKTLAGKVSLSLGPLFVRSVLCNWLVCLAVFMSMMAKDMVGKYVSILLPISTFVSIGFEHSVANMFLLPAGLLCSTGFTIKQALLNNLLPVLIGNAISGSLFVGVLFSFLFGRLGKGK